MVFKLTIDTDNAAFTDYPGELGGLIRGVADRTDRGDVSGLVRDSNGNTVGYWTLAEDGGE